MAITGKFGMITDFLILKHFVLIYCTFIPVAGTLKKVSFSNSEMLRKVTGFFFLSKLNKLIPNQHLCRFQLHIDKDSICYFLPEFNNNFTVLSLVIMFLFPFLIFPSFCNYFEGVTHVVIHAQCRPASCLICWVQCFIYIWRFLLLLLRDAMLHYMWLKCAV